jgi:hypothetical protein
MREFLSLEEIKKFEHVRLGLAHLTKLPDVVCYCT